jgi:hypothetical protein
MRRSIFAILVSIAAAFVPAAALADYAYTFQIPATASNLPAGATVQAACQLFSGPNGSGGQIGYGTSQTVSSSNGTYSGTFTVASSAPSKPGSYTCYLMISAGGKMINLINGTPTNPQSGWTGTMATTVNLP